MNLSSRWCVTFAILTVGIGVSDSPWAQIGHGDFSLRFPSPEIPQKWKASDILKFNGSGVEVDGRFLVPSTLFALNPLDEIDGISTGQDDLILPDQNFRLGLEYSAGRRSTGLGGPVSTQGGINGNGGDKFRLYITPTGRIVGPFLESDAPDHGLTPSPTESDIDGLTAPPGTRQPIYFSINRSTATSWSLQTGQSWDAAAIYVVRMPGDRPQLYATSQQLGLQRGYTVLGNLVGDDIDALAISDLGSPGVFNGNEIIWVSLDIASPTRPLYLTACDGIIQVNPPQPPVGVLPAPPALQGVVILGAPALDLACPPASAVYDELDAITAIDPGLTCDEGRDEPLWCVGERW